MQSGRFYTGHVLHAHLSAHLAGFWTIDVIKACPQKGDPAEKAVYATDSTVSIFFIGADARYVRTLFSPLENGPVS